MKKIHFLFLSLCFLSLKIWAQKEKPANLYPTNLEENMYYNGYDPASKTLKGLYFMVLSDGNNSKDKTPAFNVKIYLYQEDKDPIFVKTIEEPGIWHMGSKEYKNINIDISEYEIPDGNYRLGLLVNADRSFEEKAGDNAILFQKPLIIGAKAPAYKEKSQNKFTIKEETEETETETEEKEEK